jgi:AcrR family transcriptional regulator
MTSRGLKPYHHGALERAAIDGAIAEVETVGVGAASMRSIARRAGVSHSALAYQFRDKAGIFTAVAAEGFRLQAQMIAAAEDGTDASILGGQAYVTFALTHRGYFEVMFRPYLYRSDDPELTSARDAAFAILNERARAGLAAHRKGPIDDEDVRGLAMANWSLSHGYATLALNANISDDPATVVAQITQGLTIVGELAARRISQTDQH